MTPEQILETWMDAWYVLTPEHRQAFLGRESVQEMASLVNEPRLVEVIGRHQRLDDILDAYWSEMDEGRAMRKKTDGGRSGVRKTGTGKTGKTGTGKKGTRPSGGGPGPTGYYGGLPGEAGRPPTYDPHPGRMCPSCGRPESACACR